MKCICDVYKSPGKSDVYLYVKKEDGLTRVPKELLEKFGSPELALSFILTADRSLAKEDPAKVFSNIQDQGFHLQLPDIQLA